MSEFSRRKHREFGFPREMEVLPYFLPDLSPTNESPGSLSPRQRPYFLFAGRLEQIKGLDDVIPVFRGLQGADLVIAGDGDHGDRLRERARGMDNVHFLGRIPSDHLAQYLQNALALIVPSVCFETFGIVLIEAFREGTPVIARRVGPLPEIVHTAQAGELFDTAEDLKSVIRRFLGDSSHRRQLGEAGRKAFHTHWSESVVVPRYLDIVRTVAEKRGDLKLLEKMRSTD